MAELQQTLATLLGGESIDAREIDLRLVKKYGRPFLLLPASSRLAAQTLALYPAQTPLARLARRGFRTALTVGLSIGTEKLSVSVSQANSFVRFLCEAANQSGSPSGRSANVPPFGILVGNPNAVGQRLVFLVFNATGKPAAVIKVGVTDEAKRLIRQEREFLKSAPQISGIPRLTNTFESPEAEALAMNFIEGESPRENAEWKVQRLLTSWVRSRQELKIGETRVWTELKQHCSALPILAELAKTLPDKIVNPTIFHGDLTPWNIKVSAIGDWTVFDWERGDGIGLPGYDWFHYFIQTRILVAHIPVAGLVGELESLVSSDEFQQYADLTKISGIEQQVAIMYLLHISEVIRPGEGLNEAKELLKALEEAGWAQ
jgi:hypothetical protein